MNSCIKTLLDELIHYFNKRTPNEILLSAHQNLGSSDVFSAIQDLLDWPIKIKLELDSADHFSISQPTYERYKRLFDSCPELSKVFKLETDSVHWAEDLTNEAIEDIVDYIQNNHSVTVRIRRDRRLSRD